MTKLTPLKDGLAHETNIPPTADITVTSVVETYGVEAELLAFSVEREFVIGNIFWKMFYF